MLPVCLDQEGLYVAAVVNAMACLCDVMVVVAQVRSVHERSSFDFFLVIDPLFLLPCVRSPAPSNLICCAFVFLAFGGAFAWPSLGSLARVLLFLGFISRLAFFLLDARNHCGVERYLLLACARLFTLSLALVAATLLSTQRLRLLPQPMPGSVSSAAPPSTVAIPPGRRGA
ncbi:MAG: hypothetical protein ACO30K_08630 [bacterium]